MGNGNAGGWRYTARYDWNWRSARAMSGALASLALPMPPWFRAIVARCLLSRTALHADGEGIWGSGSVIQAGADPRPYPWKDIADVVVWDYHHLRIIGLARRATHSGADRPPGRWRPARPCSRDRSGDGPCFGIRPMPRSSHPTDRPTAPRTC
jgi:hypothetical protein